MWCCTLLLTGGKGSTGPDGDKGEKGPIGGQGTPGIKGEMGDKGTKGIKGDEGPEVRETYACCSLMFLSPSLTFHFLLLYVVIPMELEL